MLERLAASYLHRGQRTDALRVLDRLQSIYVRVLGCKDLDLDRVQSISERLRQRDLEPQAARRVMRGRRIAVLGTAEPACRALLTPGADRLEIDGSGRYSPPRRRLDDDPRMIERP